MSAHHELLVGELREWVIGESFSCLGARIAVRRESFHVALLGKMSELATTKELHDEITQFVDSTLRVESNYTTLVAVFDPMPSASEEEFDSALWGQLQDLHELDRQQYEWAVSFSSDPESSKFAFSVAAHPFFVVGMHPLASRVSRRFRLPAIAFNSHHQFERLKRSSVYPGLQQSIRKREVRLQGSINPALAEFGDTSEARQYSGRAPTEDWRCPFHSIPPKDI